MALKVGELYASMRLDNAAFDKGLEQSGRKFGALEKVITTGVKTGAKLFAATTTAVVGLGVAALNVGLDYNKMQQSSRAALTTLLGSAEAANAQMDKLDEFAKTSPFSKQVFIQAQQQMLGFGIEAEKVVPSLDAIQNAVAAMGGSNADISAIVDSLSKMQSMGKLSGIQLKELGQYGIDAAAIIGESMGKSGAEIRAMASKPGGIPVEEIWDPLVDGLMEKFGGAADNIKNQYEGAADRVKAAWRDIGSVLAEPFIDPRGGGLAVEWTNKFADGMRALETKLKPLTALMLDRFAPGIETVGRLLERAEGAINSWDISKVNSQIDQLTRYAPLIAGASAALFAMGTTNIPILSSLGFTGINPVVAGLAALVAASPDARAALGGVADAASPLLGTAKDLGIVLADNLMHALEQIVPAAGALAIAFVDAGVPLIQSLTPGLIGLMDASKPLVDVLAGLVGWVADLPTPVLAAGLAFVALAGPLKPVVDGLAGVATGFVRIIQQARVQAVLGDTNIAVGGLARASAVAGPAISGVGTALKGAFIASGVGLAITGIVAAVAAFTSSQAEARRHVEDLADSLDAQTGAWTENTNEILYAKLEVDGTADAYRRLGGDVADLIPYLQGNADAQSRVNALLDEGRGAVHESTDAWGVLTDVQTGFDESGAGLLITIEKVEEGLGKQTGALAEAEGKADDKRRAMDRLADGEDAAADSVYRHIDALNAQQEALYESSNASIGQSKALRRQEDAQDRTRDALKKLNATTKDAEASEKDIERARRDVEAALDDEASSHWDLIGAMQRNNSSTADMQSATQRARDEFIKHAKQLGYTADEARALADEYGLIPEKVHTKITADTDTARSRIQAVQDALARVQSKTVTVAVQTLGSAGSIGHVPGLGYVNQGQFADGGFRLPSQATIQSPRVGLVQWAEPETEGEAFIPLAMSKRARSLAIWEETGRRLGAFAARSFADGGFNSARPVSAAYLPAGVDFARLERLLTQVLSTVGPGVRDGVIEGMTGVASHSRMLGVMN